MDSGAGHVGPERRTGLGRDSRDHGDGLQKMLSELCALYKQESGKQLTEVYSGTIGPVAGPVQGRKRGFRIRFGQADPGGLGRLFRFVSAFGHRRACAGVEKGLNVESPQDPKSENPVHRLSRQEGRHLRKGR